MLWRETDGLVLLYVRGMRWLLFQRFTMRAFPVGTLLFIERHIEQRIGLLGWKLIREDPPFSPSGPGKIYN